MTKFHSLRPRDGWRVFAGEVGVIVIGVLIALVAQQVAENGAEIAHEGADAVGGEGAATLGLGAVVGIGGPFSLLLLGGPQRGDRSHDVGFHAYGALGLAF